MVTFNINIEGDGKSTSKVASTGSQIQLDLPTPNLQSSIEGATSNAPSPKSFDNTFESGQSLESVPHPEESGISTSSTNIQTPSPQMDSADKVNADTEIPTPSDTENGGPKSPASKRKPRATKSKSSRK